MTESTERKKKLIIDVIYLIMIIAFITIIVKYALGVCLPFVAALAFAAILQRPKNYIIKKTHLHSGPVSAALVLISIAIIIALFVLLGATLVSQVKEFLNYIISLLSDYKTILSNIHQWALDISAKLPKAIRNTAITNINDIYNNILQTLSGSAQSGAENAAQSSSALSGIFSFSTLSKPISGIVSTAKQIPSMLIAGVMSIVACCFMTSEFNKITAFVTAQFPDSRKDDLVRAKTLLRSSLGKMAKAYALIMLVTFTEISVGLYILNFLGIFRSSFIIPIAIITAIVDIIPILGTGTIVLPWAAYSLITANYKMAIGLIVIYIFITVLRQIIEPKLVAGQLGLSPVVTITAMFFGLKVFGVLGMIVTPLLIIMLKLLNDEGIIHLWKSPKAEITEEEPKKKVKAPKKAKAKK